MSRRVLPCGLGGVIGGHQEACWPLLSGRMAPLRWFLGLPVLDRWSSVSAALAACLLCRRRWPPACSLVRIRVRLCFIRLSPPSALWLSARHDLEPEPHAGDGGAGREPDGVLIPAYRPHAHPG